MQFMHYMHAPNFNNGAELNARDETRVLGQSGNMMCRTSSLIRKNGGLVISGI